MSALRAVRPDERQQTAAEWTHPRRLALVVAGSWLVLGFVGYLVWRWLT